MRREKSVQTKTPDADQPRGSFTEREAPERSPGNDIVSLQRTMGNRAVSRLLRTGPPGDVYEQEADCMAESVARGGPAPGTPLSSAPQGAAQRLAKAETPTPEPKTAAMPAAPVEAASGGPGPEREAAGTGLVVEDDTAQAAPGRMRKSEFLDALRASVCAASSEAMAGTGRTSDDCPWIDYWFSYYAGQDASHVEKAILKFAPEAAGITSAGGYIPIVTVRVRKSVETFTRTGELNGMPDLPEGASMGAGLLSSFGGMFFKARSGGVHAANPAAVRGQLGRGQAMPGGLRSRMESAFGSDFSGVRLHTDSAGSQLSDQLGARAFTVGEHVAFGSGEFRPDTPQGEALIAHELAHVVQQGSGKSGATAAGQADHAALEENADGSAIGAVASLWGGTKVALRNIARNAVPRLKSGLQLQGCGPKFVTNRGATVETLSSGAPPLDPDVSEPAADAQLSSMNLLTKVTKLKPPTNDYDCHGFTFLGGDRWINDGEVEAILKDNGYSVTAAPVVGDIVVYRSGGNITHSGVIVGVSGTTVTLVESKWGRLGLYRHAPADVPPTYGLWMAYHTDRGSHRLRSN